MDYIKHPASYNIVNHLGETKEVRLSFIDWFNRLKIVKSLQQNPRTIKDLKAFENLTDGYPRIDV
jgi:hypothetical protein